MRRRRFLRLAGGAGAGGLFLPDWLAGQTGRIFALRSENERPPFHPPQSPPDGVRIVLLHTNDTHSRIDPFPQDGGPYAGLGGVARRASLVDRIRAREANVLLLDSGDIFQRPPYFNFFHRELEFEAMSAMAYDVATLGNHDFDNGVEGLAEMMPHADFAFVSANYEVSGTPLAPRVQGWTVREMEGVKVGIFGLGIAFDGVVPEPLHRGVRYLDPYGAARRAVSELKAEGCSQIVCLSHLGYRYRGDRPSDTRLAQEVRGIDLILGGHTHTFMDRPDVYQHEDGSRTLVHQVGFGGMRLGRIDVIMDAADAPAGWAAGGYSIDDGLD